MEQRALWVNRFRFSVLQSSLISWGLRPRLPVPSWCPPHGCYPTPSAFTFGLASVHTPGAALHPAGSFSPRLPSSLWQWMRFLPPLLMRKLRHRIAPSCHPTWAALALKPPLSSLGCNLSTYIPTQFLSLFLLRTTETG